MQSTEGSGTSDQWSVFAVPSYDSGYISACLSQYYKSVLDYVNANPKASESPCGIHFPLELIEEFRIIYFHLVTPIF